MPYEAVQRFVQVFLLKFLTPSRIFMMSFAGLIALGALLLMCPFASGAGDIRWVDALFTATSAVCVTGLAVIDVGRDLSISGQVLTIFLFQIGGLGIITFSAFLFGMMARSISFRGREIVQSTFLHTPQKDFYIILKSVFISTFIIESVGVVLLFVRFVRDFSPGWALYHAVYNSISAFNNCGYSLFSDSLTRYRGDALVNFTVMGLIILGGIGFVVIHEVAAKVRNPGARLSLHTKMVLITTSVLIVGGAILLYVFERGQLLKGLPLETKILACLFQSVTPRTAGFNTIDIGMLTNESILLMIILMFVGASPGSTGGGVKTTSATLLWLLIWNRWKGSEEVNVFNRTIPKEVLSRTVAIIFASAVAVCIIVSVLLWCNPTTARPDASRHFFVEYLFETVSAFGTVGLSMGVTPHLNDIQKIAIILLMFAGRVGPLTLAFSLTLRASRRTLTYAEETVMVG